MGDLPLLQGVLKDPKYGFLTYEVIKPLGPPLSRKY
jgi:hypothetical protein